MPTAAKLFAAIAFALVGWIAAEVYKPLLSDGTQFGFFSEICAAIGALCGWLILGRFAGQGYATAAGVGARVALTIVFWALLGFAIQEMVLLSMKLRYDGAMEAVLAVFDIMLQKARLLADPRMIGVVLGGGALGGAVSEFAARRWR